ncbi:outer membrane protein OmpT [Vibrio cincinnatiensis]|uniref:Outer membrane protein OmpT n=2 Tax=Vibrio cincinnatiensis TaxID=675 RepID=A0A1T4K546_VIBCI|nr:outer membrane protein OmpT [Vibrio cincinnatiensis DSM 19608]SUP48813.1 outer membrane protein OmpT [Vibrio cincinnatiensis]
MEFPSKKRQWINMKKTLVALLVASAATSVNAAEVFKTDDVLVDFYGQLRQTVKFTDKSNTDAKIDQGSSRVGVNLTYNAIEEGLDVVAKVEYRVDEDWHLRQHYIGLSTEFGVMTFGKHSPLYDDVYGAIYAYEYDLAPYIAGGGLDENFWQTSAIKYQLDLDNSWIKAQYNLAENNSNPELFELYVGTSYDALSLHIGGASMSDKTSGNVDSTYFEATAEYALGKGVIGFTYAYNKDKDKVANTKAESDGFHLGAKYEVASKTSLYGGGQFINGKKEEADVTNLYLGVEYMFAKWARTYVEYNFNDTDGQSDVNNLAIGARVYW